MKPLGDLDTEAERILREARELLAILRQHVKDQPSTVAEAISILSAVRHEIYEDLNQLQHEYLIIKAANWLREANYIPEGGDLFWNPRQTGDDKEPDLAISRNGKRVVSAEVTASKSPKGLLDTRMAKTLTKLNVMEGEKFYFVCTSEMRQRAETKISKAKWPIRIVTLQNEISRSDKGVESDAARGHVQVMP
jgi:hypothetical protein